WVENWPWFCKADKDWAPADNGYIKATLCDRDGNLTTGATSGWYLVTTVGPYHLGCSAGHVFPCVPADGALGYIGVAWGVATVPAVPDTTKQYVLIYHPTTERLAWLETTTECEDET